MKSDTLKLYLTVESFLNNDVGIVVDLKSNLFSKFSVFRLYHAMIRPHGLVDLVSNVFFCADVFTVLGILGIMA